MTVKTILNPAPLVLSRSHTIEDALKQMVQHHVRSLPVVDENGKYLGSFGIHRMMKIMLPMAATMDSGAGTLKDLSFVSDSIDHLREKWLEIRTQPVIGLLDPDVPAIQPDTSILEAVLLIYQKASNLPVVDPQSGKLAGLVSPWEILNRLM